MRRQWLVPALLALLALIWLVPLGGRSLLHTDEGRYATLSLNILLSGDWITPRLNGLLYFEKPALQYWIGATAFLLLGINEFTARLWPGLAGLLTVFAIGFTGWRLWGAQAGIRALAIAAGTTWIIANSHFLTLDAGLGLFLTLVLCAMLLAERTGISARTQRNWVWCAWASMAGAVLSKGLVGVVIPCGVLVIVCLWQRDAGLLRRMRWLSGTLIFLAIAAPWFVLVSLRNPAFAEFFFIHEHFARYLTNVHQREGAWWYYLPLLLIGLLPWTSGLPWLLLRRPAAQPSRQHEALRLLLAWAGFVFIFFSISHSKLPSYILPMFPALALLLTERLRHVASATALRWHLAFPALLWMAALVLSPQLQRLMSPGVEPQAVAQLALGLQVGAVVFLAGAGLAWWWLGQQRLTAALVVVAFAHLVAVLVAMQSYDSYGQAKSAARLSKVLRPLISADTPVFAVQDYDQTLPFYLGRNVILVNYVNEFEFGEKQEPQRWIPTLDAFVPRWQALPKAAAYMPLATLQKLQERGLPMRVVFEDRTRAVVVKP